MTLSSIKCFLSTSLEFTVGKTATAEEGWGGGGWGQLQKGWISQVGDIDSDPREAGGVSC